MTEEPSLSLAKGRWSGMVVGGSLADGLDIRLDPGASVEAIKVGTLVTVEGERLRFFGQITDVSLKSADRDLALITPDVSNPFIARVVSGTTAFGAIKVAPRLALSKEEGLLGEGPQPAKTVPAHFSRVTQASERDIELIFGREDKHHFWIGNPLDMETKLCLDVAEFVKRSNGVFGKSGTGKTFLTRLLLTGILQSGQAANLVLDMHGEYGWRGSSESGSREVKGLKQLFPSKVAVFSLDERHSRRRGISPDYLVRIGYEDIEPEDVQVLGGALELSPQAADAAYPLKNKYGASSWLRELLSLKGTELNEAAKDLNVNPNALSALQRRLTKFQRFRFMSESGAHDSVAELLQYLGRGIHVVLEFGDYGNDLDAYVVVANLLTRRIYERYRELTDQAMTESSSQPTPLVITVEEAHKFLTPEVAGKTIFGTIAREMRKYNVTLLVVDQRPSQIDDEVMSQLGTRFVCLLDDERDVKAVLAGAPGGSKLHTVLASLDSKQQALVFGHAVPMPVEIRVRDYGTAESYRSLGLPQPAERKAKRDADMAGLFPPRED